MNFFEVTILSLDVEALARHGPKAALIVTVFLFVKCMSTVQRRLDTFRKDLNISYLTLSKHKVVWKIIIRHQMIE